MRRHGKPLVEDRRAPRRSGASGPRSRWSATRPSHADALERGEHPGAGGSLTSSRTPSREALHGAGAEILGPYGSSRKAREGVPARDRHGWASRLLGLRYLWSRAGTIYAGSSEIQKNVIGGASSACQRKPARSVGGKRELLVPANQVLLKNSVRAALEEHCKSSTSRMPRRKGYGDELWGEMGKLAGSASPSRRSTAARGSAWSQLAMCSRRWGGLSIPPLLRDGGPRRARAHAGRHRERKGTSGSRHRWDARG